MAGNLGKISITIKGNHIISNPYERLSLVKSNTDVWYLSLWDVPANIELTDQGYWELFFDPAVNSQQVADNAQAITFLQGQIVPSGAIVMWNGAVNNVPTDWALCDGTNGTPDLRNRFIVGAGGTYSKGDTGGSKDAVVVSHNHTINHDHPNVTTSAAGNHRHYHGGEQAKYLKAGASGGACYAWYLSSCSQGSSTKVGDGYTGYAGNHTHTLNVPNYSGNSGSKGVSGVNKNLPPYYALAYIMKL